jgi:chromosome segregation ATPase
LQTQASGNSEIEELLSIRGQELASSTKVQLLDAEAQWHDLSGEKLPLQKSIHQRTIQSLEKTINDWNHQIASRKQSELDLQIQAARQAALETHPALREFSLGTSRLAQSRGELAEVNRQLQNEKLRIEKQQHDIQQQLQHLKKHEEAFKNGGNSESNQTLIEAHRNLAPPWEAMARISQLKRELSLNRSNKLALRERLDELADPQQFIQQHLNIIQDEPVANTTLMAMAEESIDSYRRQLLALVGDYEKVDSLLNDIKSRREETLENIKSTRKLVDAYALWVQDAAPLSIELLDESRDGAAKFFASEQWAHLGQTVITNVQQRPWRPAVGLIGLLATFVIGKRFES